ncbi:hypothetical protein ZWY2020_044529 [Hordeum vulgare]|nr:hypothetical protein ZWY2020_044529 [Hordeum vulgare]
MARVFLTAVVAAGRAVARTASRAGKGPLLLGGIIITAYVYREHLRRLASCLFASRRGPDRAPRIKAARADNKGARELQQETHRFYTKRNASGPR